MGICHRQMESEFGFGALVLLLDFACDMHPGSLLWAQQEKGHCHFSRFLPGLILATGAVCGLWSPLLFCWCKARMQTAEYLIELLPGMPPCSVKGPSQVLLGNRYCYIWKQDLTCNQLTVLYVARYIRKIFVLGRKYFDVWYIPTCFKTVMKKYLT